MGLLVGVDGLLQAGLAGGAVRALEPRARASVNDIADGVIGRGACDFMADVALRIPAEVFLEHMGLPLAHADDIVATPVDTGKLNKKGGLGIGSKPGSVVPDGIEAKIIALAKKPLDNKALEAQARDLERLIGMSISRYTAVSISLALGIAGALAIAALSQN